MRHEAIQALTVLEGSMAGTRHQEQPKHSRLNDIKEVYSSEGIRYTQRAMKDKRLQMLLSTATNLQRRKLHRPQ